MGGQIAKEKAVIEEKKRLDALQEAEGSSFPGSETHYEDYKEWMSTLNLDKLRVYDVMWPGSHDSATNKIGVPCVTRPFAQCQELSIYSQLVQGVRVFDIRVNQDRNVCHGILKTYKVDVVLDDLKRFLTETKSEIVILEIRTEFGYTDPPDFDKWLIDQLGDYLVPQDESYFSKTLREVLPHRVFCIWKPDKAPAPSPGSKLWSSAYLKDNWTDTDMPATKFDANMSHLADQQPNSCRKYFYRVENTATPQTSSVVLCVKPVTNRIRGYARLFVSQAFKKGLGDRLSIYSEDFVDGDFVDICIGVAISRCYPDKG